MAQMQFALMLWPTDGNMVSIHALNYVRIPKKAFNDYVVGDECLTFYPNEPGNDGVSEQGEELWRSVILAVGESRQSLLEVRKNILTDVAAMVTKEHTAPEISNLYINWAKGYEQKETVGASEQRETGGTKTPAINVQTGNKKAPSTQRRKCPRKETTKNTMADGADKAKRQKVDKSKLHANEPNANGDEQETECAETPAINVQTGIKKVTSPEKRKCPRKETSNKTCSTAGAGEAQGEKIEKSKQPNESKAKQKKFAKALEAAAQDLLVDDLEKELRESQVDLQLLEKEPEGSLLKELEPIAAAVQDNVPNLPLTSLSVSEVLQQTTDVLYPEQRMANSFNSLNNQLNEPCTGCWQLTNRVKSLENNVQWLWGEVQTLKQQVPSRLNWWQAPDNSGTSSASKKPSSFSAKKPSNFSTPKHSPAAPAASSCLEALSPITGKSSEMPSAAAEVPSTTSNTEVSPELDASNDDEDKVTEITRQSSITNLDDSAVYNGFTVGQLKSAATRKKSFSKAAKHLLDMMFTAEEKQDRCLEDYSRTTKDGKMIIKKGLEDLEKLDALQDIVQAVYQQATPRKVKKKLPEKLKPSAN